MKFKEKRGNTFVFEKDGEELELERGGCTSAFFWFGDIAVNTDLAITIDSERINVSFSEIQTAVQMMQILIDEGLI